MLPSLVVNCEGVGMVIIGGEISISVIGGEVPLMMVDVGGVVVPLLVVVLDG